MTGDQPPATRGSLVPRIAAGAVSGALLLLAFPPLDQRWAAFVALIPLLLALRDATWPRGLLIGGAFGWTFFGILLFWIAGFGVVAWAALTGALAAYAALFGALGAAIMRLGPVGRLLGVPLLWVGIEMARGRFPLGGFTWGGMGYSQHTGGPALPVARIGGVYLTGLVVVAVNALLAEAIASSGGRARVRLGAIALLLALAPALLPVGLAGPVEGAMDVAAVQGNVPRGHFTGFGRSGRRGPEDETIIRNHLAVTERLIGQPPLDLVVWPENAFDVDPLRNPALFAPVQELARRLDAPFVIGAIRGGERTFYNSNLLLDADGSVRAIYDKTHLVPFGEYVPFGFARSLLPVLDQEIPVDGTAGSELQVFETPAGRVGTLICFESTFPELARASVRNGAQVIVVTTNNASFGTSPASAQHLATSRLRAVEHGRPVVHAAISGISAIIQPDGEIVERSALFTPALLRAQVPLTTGTTPYTRYGSGIEMAIGLGAAAAVVAGLVAARRRREP